MYHSNLEDRKKEPVLSPEDDNELDDISKLHAKFLNKERAPIKSNGNITNKRGAVSFNIGRIMPRNITHDKQFLYEENIKLKESVQQFRDQVLKLRTRLSVSEKQKTKIADDFHNTDFAGKNSSSRIVKRHGSLAYTSFQNQNYLKKMLRDTKDEVDILKNQNTRLKKTVKYTQICELQTQNKCLIQQCQRLTNIIQNKLEDQNEIIEQYESKINDLKEQLQEERDNNRSVINQSKKKNEQIESLRFQINELNQREKKLKKQLADLKKKPTQNKKGSDSLSNMKNNDIRSIENNQVQTKRVKTKQKQPAPLAKTEIKGKINTLSLEETGKQAVDQKKTSIVKIDTDNDTNKNGNRAIKQIEEKAKKQIEAKDEEYGDQFQEKDKDQQKDNAEEYGEESFDDKPQSNNNQDEAQKDDYQDEFDQVYEDKSQKQQILFTKNGRQISNQESLKQTITYRLMCQRYTYKDLQSDIKESEMKQFTLEQIASMLNDEPFFLTEEQIQWVLSFIFQRNDLHLEDKVKAKEFLAKIKPFIGDFVLMSEEKEQQFMQKCLQTLQKHKKQFKKKCKAESDSNQNITKDSLVQILKSFKMSKEQIDILLGEASLVSNTINEINYNTFINKLVQ